MGCALVASTWPSIRVGCGARLAASSALPGARIDRGSCSRHRPRVAGRSAAGCAAAAGCIGSTPGCRRRTSAAGMAVAGMPSVASRSRHGWTTLQPIAPAAARPWARCSSGVDVSWRRWIRPGRPWSRMAAGSLPWRGSPRRPTTRPGCRPRSIGRARWATAAAGGRLAPSVRIEFLDAGDQALRTAAVPQRGRRRVVGVVEGLEQRQAGSRGHRPQGPDLLR